MLQPSLKKFFTNNLPAQVNLLWDLFCALEVLVRQAFNTEMYDLH